MRGNEIAVEGEEAEVVGRLFEELVLLLQQGHPIDPSVVRRTVDMVQAHERPSEVLTTEVLRGSKGRTRAPEDERAEPLHRRDPRRTSSRS